MRQWHPWSKGESNTSPSSWTSHHDHHLPNSWCPHHTSGSACNLGFLWWWSREAKAQRCRKAESIAKCYPWTAQSLRWPPYWLIVCSARMTQWSCPSSRSAQSAWRKTFLWMRSGKSASRRYCSSWNQSWRFIVPGHAMFCYRSTGKNKKTHISTISDPTSRPEKGLSYGLENLPRVQKKAVQNHKK